ncbi:MAG: hypothetical protein IT452_20340 [Planctomycetia bacterium]|nr:hypothetical protein [Planctomycetia bacterium]
MRYSSLIPIPVLALIALAAFGHTGSPPPIPTIDETAPAAIISTDTSCTVTGTTWCLYGVAPSLTCKKNGNTVNLTFNSITTNSPHAYHVDTIYDVNLTPLNLAAGDVLVWTFSAYATSGPYAGRVVRTSKTTYVH